MHSSPSSLQGVLAASLTPLKPDLSIDHERLISHCDWLLSNGCNGVAFMGTTGEANSFSLTERIDALDALIEGGINPETLMVGTGCCALPDTLTLTRHALSKQVAGVLLLPPFYYKGVPDDGIYASCDALIQQIGDSRLRIYLYHFPYMSQVPFSDAVIDKLLNQYPSTITGIKDSSGDWDHILHLINTFPSLNVFAGTEQYLLATLRAGGVGCISASANLTAPLAAQVRSHSDTKEGKQLQETLTKARLAIQSKPMIPALKGLWSQRTNIPDWAQIRPPLVALPQQEITALDAELQTILLDR